MLEFMIGLSMAGIIGFIWDSDFRKEVIRLAVIFSICYGFGVVLVSLWKLL